MSDPTIKRSRLTSAARRQVIERAATEVFAERGYHGAAVSEIASRAGITVPVLYDHFDSKRALYIRLIEAHYADLAAVWLRHAAAGGTLERWLGDAIAEWFEYVRSHPFAGRMLFRDTSGDPVIAAMHQQVENESRGQLLPLVGHVVNQVHPDLGGALGVDLAWEVVRSLLQGLALWWYDHPDVPHERMVATAMNTIWIGFERLTIGDVWRPGSA